MEHEISICFLSWIIKLHGHVPAHGGGGGRGGAGRGGAGRGGEFPSEYIQITSKW